MTAVVGGRHADPRARKSSYHVYLLICIQYTYSKFQTELHILPCICPGHRQIQNPDPHVLSLLFSLCPFIIIVITNLQYYVPFPDRVMVRVGMMVRWWVRWHLTSACSACRPLRAPAHAPQRKKLKPISSVVQETTYKFCSPGSTGTP